MTTRAPATFVIGPLGRIEDADDGACHLLGYSRAELCTLHGSQLIPPAERAGVAVSLDRMRHGEIERREGRLLRKDGATVRVEVRATPLEGGRLRLAIVALSGEPA